MRLRVLAVLLFLPAVCAAPSGAATPEGPSFQDEVSKQTEIYRSRGQDVPEGYVIGRSLLSYSFALGEDFKSALANLGPKARWLDIGAGEGRAILDYQSGKYDVMLPGIERHGRKAQAVGISIEDRRTPQWYETAASLEPNHIQYFFGRRLREYPLAELGQFEVITDLLGAFSYTRYPSVFMEKTLAFLKVRGSLFTVLQDVHFENGTNRPYYPNAPFLTEIVKPDRSELKVCSWVKSITCVEVACEPKPDWTPPIEVYRIRKVCDDVKVPALIPTHFAAGTPPERGFQIAGPSSPPLAPIPPAAP
jgi:SAM-dependent methyltransferase